MKQINVQSRAVTMMLAVALPLVACTGGPTGTAVGSNSGLGPNNQQPGGGTASRGADDPSDSPAVFSPAAGSFKRLTASELSNSLKALLGNVTIGPLEPDTFVSGFAKVGGSTVSISLNGVQQYQRAIEGATAEVFADSQRASTLIGCTPSTSSDTACFKSFIQRFGRLAWRRALTVQEVDREVALVTSLTSLFGNTTDALRSVTNALLLSPNFLYRLERGAADPSSKFFRYTGYETASRLSYFLTNNAPDDALLSAAEHGTLDTSAGVRAEAERLLAGSSGRESVRNFATELFRLAIIAGRAKDLELFPNYSPSLQQAMIREVPSMLEDLVFEQKAPATDLFSTRTTFVNADLARLYGLNATGMTTDSWVKVTLPEDGRRAGFLGTAAFLSQFANQKEGSPTTRGKFIRATLLCQPIPDPPGDVSPVLVDDPDGMPTTKRQKLAVHRQKGSTCAGCHSLMDPLGLPLENFDAIGAYRATDAGLPLDLSGDLDGAVFNGPVELGQLLSKNDQVGACLIRNLYRYATGVAEAPGQEPAITQLVMQFQSNGHDLRGSMLELVASDAFRLVAATP